MEAIDITCITQECYEKKHAEKFKSRYEKYF